ncbi:hypothetical protein [Hymenobacter terrestris]|uniref:Sulfatase-modifying factor enzyme domain-containing protein n=1 Tax=Hymenobacter terrestris TaxID=2748310 RepID=A0ABX2Q1A1_9BACT|nr:hypothetical protein [Hymenobacter terrestris]NVO84047.1 hypothetical protein [Hymenobacter terrestris]
METSTTDSNEAYKYWAMTPVPAEVTVNHGQYWQSAHFTREYITYLDLTTTAEWSQEYIRQNGLVPNNGVPNRILPPDSPRWFSPDSSFSAYSRLGVSGVYYLQTRTGRMLIYEEQF